MTNIENQDIHKKNYDRCMISIKRAFSRNMENINDGAFFFQSDDYLFNDNQIQCLFCKHGNYYRDFLDFRCIINDFCTPKIYCEECTAYESDYESDYESNYENDIDYESQ